MEGPQFSTLAESLTYKQLGYSVIGMTNMPEAKLAREAEICYATVAMVTDFDCWHPDHDAVTVQDIIKVLLDNADRAKRLVARLARDFPREHEPCPIGSDRALDTALITAPEARDPELIKKLDAVAGRVLEAAAYSVDTRSNSAVVSVGVRERWTISGTQTKPRSGSVRRACSRRGDARSRDFADVVPSLACAGRRDADLGEDVERCCRIRHPGDARAIALDDRMIAAVGLEAERAFDAAPSRPRRRGTRPRHDLRRPGCCPHRNVSETCGRAARGDARARRSKA